MMENYSSLIKLVMKASDEELSDVCVCVSTTEAIYPFSFIEYEDDDYLGIFYTAEDFSERFIILDKKYVTSVKVMYQQDLDLNPTEDVMYQ